MCGLCYSSAYPLETTNPSASCCICLESHKFMLFLCYPLNPSSGFLLTRWSCFLHGETMGCKTGWGKCGHIQRLVDGYLKYWKYWNTWNTSPLGDGQDFVRQPLREHYTTIFAATLLVALPPPQEVQVQGRDCNPSVLLTMVLHLDPWNKHHTALERFSANVQLCRTTANCWWLWKIRPSRSLAGDMCWADCVLQSDAHLAAPLLSLSTGQNEKVGGWDKNQITYQLQLQENQIQVGEN